MNISFWSIGHKSNDTFEKLVQKYGQLCQRYRNTDLEIIDNARLSHGNDPRTQKKAEAELVLKKIDKGIKGSYRLVLLDEKGKQKTSREFASFLQSHENYFGQSRLIFLSGGPYGFDPQLYDLAQSKLSLSKMTFPHHLIRVLFMEQLYRAFTIIANEKYHND